MAIAATYAGAPPSLTSSTDAAAFTSAAFTFVSGTLYLIAVGFDDAEATGEVPNSVVLNGATPPTVTRVTAATASYATQAAPKNRLTLWWVVGDGVSRQIVVTMPDAGTGCVVFVTAVTGADNTNPIVQAVGGGGSNSSPSLTLAAFADPVNNAGLIIAGNASTSVFTADTAGGWAAVGTNLSHTVPSHRLAVAFRLGEDTSPTMAVANVDWGAVAIEIRAPVSAVNLVVQDAAHGHSGDGVVLAIPGLDIIDTFSRTVVDGWGTADSGQTWVSTLGAADHDVAGGVGTLLVAASITRRPRIGATTITDGEITTKVKIDTLPASASTDIGLAFRYTDSNNDYYVKARWNSVETNIQLFAGYVISGSGSALGATLTTDIAKTTNYVWIKALFQTDGTGIRIRAKVWLDGQAEPGYTDANKAIDRTDDPARKANGDLAILFTGGGGVTTILTVDEYGVDTTPPEPPLTLAVQDGAHAHAADVLPLVQTHNLVVADGRSPHAGDSLGVLSGGSTLVVADSRSAHSADVLGTFSGGSTLVVADSRSPHTADNLTLAGGSTLVVADSRSPHTADLPSLVQQHTLEMAGLSYSDHAADNVVLTQAHVLVVQDASHTHRAGSLPGVPPGLNDFILLTQNHVLVVQDSTHASSADVPVLGVAGSVGPADGFHPHTADSPTLTQVHNLVVADGRSPHTTDPIGLTGGSSLVLADARSTHAADNITLVPAGAFSPDDLTGLTVWHDALDYSVGSWPNKGSGPDPSFVSSPAPAVSPVTLNGLPVVRFKVNEGRLRGTGMVVDGSYDLSVFYVGRIWGTTVGRIFTNTYPPFNYLVGAHTSLDEWLYDNGAGSVSGVGWSLPSAWKLYENVSSETPRESRLWVNGVDKGFATTSAGHDNRYNISGYDATGTPETCDCEVAELVVYDRALSASERAQVTEYLNVKWFGAAPSTDLVVQDAGHQLRSGSTPENPPGLGDAIALTQTHNLQLAGLAYSDHHADNVVLTTQAALVVADARSGHTADQPTFTQVHILVVADSRSGHTTDPIALTTQQVMVVADSRHPHTADVVALFGFIPYVPPGVHGIDRERPRRREYVGAIRGGRR